jgi:hypothetical protein
MEVTKEFKKRAGKDRILYKVKSNTNIYLYGTFNKPGVYYVDTFASNVKGEGKKLLCYVIRDLVENHAGTAFMQLSSAPESQHSFSSLEFKRQQEKLNKYYEHLGFISLKEDMHEYIGKLDELYAKACI